MISTTVEMEQARIERAADEPRASSVPEGEPARLSFSQEQLWFLQRLDPAMTAYNLPRVFKLMGPVDARALAHAFEAVIARHAVLRTRFFEHGGVPMQVLRPATAFTLDSLDLTAHSRETREELLRERIEKVAAHVFDLGRPPALVACLIKLQEHEHVLAVCLHHIVSDAWSNPILAQDLSLAYRLALRRGGAVRLEPLPIEYVDYAAWQRERAKAGTLERHIEYWNTYLGAELPPLNLPVDLARPVEQTFDGDAVEVYAAAPLRSALRDFCRAERCTPFVPLLSAWQALLARWSGQDEFAVGVPAAGRHREELQGLMGFFVTTLAYRVRLASGMTLRQLCRQVRADSIAALEHAEVPFDLLLARRKDRREPGRSPLFQVMFDLQVAADASAVELDGLQLDVMDPPRRGAKYELTLNVLLRSESVCFSLEYNSRLFSRGAARRCLGSYMQLLESALAAPDRPLERIDIVTHADRAQLRRWGERTHGSERVEPLHRLIEQQADRAPHSVALVLGDAALSYGELNSRANLLAHQLVALGVAPELRVGIAFERSIEMVIGLLAILKAGGAYVPLDPDYPSERLAYMTEDSGISLLLTHSRVRARVPVPARVPVIEIDTLDLSNAHEYNPAVAVHPESLVYVIYTSGSTGKPKGAQLSHCNVARLLNETRHWFEFDAHDVWTLFHSCAFDFSVWEIFGALTSGGKLVIVPFWVSRAPHEFLQLLRAQQVTVLNQTPSAFLQLASLPQAREPGLALRLVIFGGEALEPLSLKPWIEHFGDERPQLVNMYGITETTVHVTYRPITRADLQSRRSPVGVAIPDLGPRVLDGALNEVPIGVAGELYVSGAGLARGYLQRSGLTAERFIADPFDEHGGRLYRTGDRVRWTAEGQLEYLGRTDQQLKIRGFRIEPGEIEAQLLSEPRVRQAVVMARETPRGAQLVAYVASDEQPLDAGVLRERLSAALPGYMVPSAIVVLDELPLDANGKVDRRALPAPEVNDSRAYEPPQGEVEAMFARVWGEVLDVERIGRHDNFFELGGHSLLALRLLERLRAHGWTVEVRTLFQKPQLAALAQAISRDSHARAVAVPANLIPADCTALRPEMLTLIELDEREISHIEAAVPGGAANVQDIYPLAPLQEGMLFHHLLQTDADAYVTAQTIAFDGRGRLESFVEHINRVIARHDILRTAVLWEGLHEPVQVVHRSARLQVEWLACDGARGEEAIGVLDARAHPRRSRIDVRVAPMFQAFAVHDERRQRWLLRLLGHHLVDDNTTVKRLIEEIALLQQGREAELPAPIPFRRFVAQSRLGVTAAEHEAFFRGMLGDVSEPTAPFGLLDVRGDGTEVEEARLALDEQLSREIRRQAQRHGVSPAAVFHLAWAVVLGKCAGRQDVVFGTVLFGRMQGLEGAERALGMFINTLPVRVRLGARSVGQCLRETHEALTGLMRHEHASLSLAQRCSGVPSGTPLFSALLNYRYGTSRDEDEPSDAWHGIEVLSTTERTNYPIGMSVDDLADGFELVSHVSAVLSAERFARYLRTATAEVVAALAQLPERSVCGIDILSEPERSRIEQWSVNADRYDTIEPVHRSFECWAKQTPAASALVFGDTSLSYEELNRQANRLAHRLIALGVKPEVRVGIALERSVEMIVSLLAALKAGGAYVPLDMEHPPARLAYMAEDSGIALLLTHRTVRERVPVSQRVRVIDLDAIDLRDEPEHDPDIAVHADSLAYVIYTSGSTGRPKGAAIRHRSLASCMLWMQRTYGLTSADTVLHKAPFGFDVSAWEIFWPLTCGVRLVVAQPQDHRDPARITELIERHGITTLNFVPAMLQAFLAHDGIEARTRLRYVICGGEAMPAATQSEALRRLSGASLQNLYGPTETTIHVTSWTCRDDGGSRVPIGRPISETRAYVLDETLGLVPQGVAGELCIGGELLGRGYLHRPGLTCERFVADPFDTRGGRLYRTGDLVRWNGEGQLEYLGRIDHQVKIRGLRIEPGEVEAQLLALAQVRDAVVTVREGEGGARLVAYVCATAGFTIDTTVLTAKLGDVLPGYMVPSAIVVLERMPLNANGKVDRSALPEPEIVQSGHYEPPRGEQEEMLAGIWAQVLGVERVGRTDHFFELGGHSLLALRVIERLRARGVTTPVRTLFQFPQVAAFAYECARAPGKRQITVPPNGIPERCEALRPEMLTLIELDDAQLGLIENAVPGGAENVQDIYPLAPLQEGILFHHILQSRGDAYVTPCLLSFDSRARLEGFMDRLNRVIARHDILRTAVLWEGLGEPVQVVCRQAALELEWLKDPGSRDVRQSLHAEVDPRHHRIDVRQAPMMRALAANDPGNDRWLLQLATHHLVLDHGTLEGIVEEIALLQQGREAELPAPIPFRRFVAQSRLGVTAAEHDAFFRGMLGDVSEPTAPFGLLDVRGDGTEVEEARLALDEQLSREIRRQAQRHGVIPAAVFHLAWAVVLGKCAGRQDVVFGTVLFGRMQGLEGAERALGMFINTLPVRVRLGARSVGQCLRETHEALTGLMHHEHASLSLAQRCSGVPSGTPLFSALLNYRYGTSRDEDEPSDAWQGIEVLSATERTNYPIELSVDDRGQRFDLLAYAPGEVDPQRLCEQMRGALRGVVTALAQRAAQPVTQLDILSAAERALLQRWGINDERHARNEPVHRLFEQRVRTTPAAIAVILGDEALSYAELNRKANQLAHRLISLGVAPEVRVGVALERSLDMVVALLAILKAGGAYVPLDPDYPPKRLAHMQRDSGVSVVLVHRSVRVHFADSAAIEVIEIETLDLPSARDDDPRVDLHGENIAYLIYTSGSTGLPKGIAITHAALAEHSHVTCGYFGLTREDRMLQFSTINFDASVEQLFAPLVAGAAVVLRGPDLWDSETFYRELHERRVTIADLPTSYWHLLVQDFARAGQRDYGALRQVQATGEAMPPEGLKHWRDAGLSHVKLLNTYGPTEAVVTASAQDVQGYIEGERSLPHQLPIGPPLAGRHAYVLDADLNLAPAGVAGELYIGGALLARGYHRRPALSAERFIADPFDTAGGRMYRTGDLARWNAQGELEYLGRVDHQVKLRGYRIELGEIEAALLAEPEVAEAVVVTKADPAGGRLVAYISTVPNQSIDGADLLVRLGARLPAYTMPGAIIVLPALPKNASGKIDRHSLPEPEASGDLAGEAPAGELEEAIAAVWAEVLGCERIGRDDDFFTLGGHSLLALRLIERMRARLEVHPPIRLADLYANPSVRLLASRRAESKIVRLNAQCASSEPLIVIHDGLGSVLDYTVLARALEGRCTVLALPYANSRREHSPTSLDVLAAEHADTIIAAGIAEPYRLCGWSLGGALAPLIAGALERRGRRVSFVGAIDPYVPDAEHTAQQSREVALRQFIKALYLEPPRLSKQEAARWRRRIDRAARAPKMIAGVIDDLLSTADQARLREHARLGGAELSEIFSTAFALAQLARVPIDPPALHAPLTVWWSYRRAATARRHFATWLKPRVIQEERIRAGHYELVRLSHTIESLARALE